MGRGRVEGRARARVRARVRARARVRVSSRRLGGEAQLEVSARPAHRFLEQ